MRWLMLFKTHVFGVLCLSLFFIPMAHAQTPDMGNSLVASQQVATLRNALESALRFMKVEISEVKNVLGKHELCANRKGFYAPSHAQADTQGCVVPRSGTPAVNYQNCSITRWAGKRHEAGKILGTNIQSNMAAEHYCPKGMVMVGVNNESVDSALCCTLMLVDE